MKFVWLNKFFGFSFYFHLQWKAAVCCQVEIVFASVALEIRVRIIEEGRLSKTVTIPYFISNWKTYHLYLSAYCYVHIVCKYLPFWIFQEIDLTELDKGAYWTCKNGGSRMEALNQQWNSSGSELLTMWIGINSYLKVGHLYIRNIQKIKKASRHDSVSDAQINVPCQCFKFGWESVENTTSSWRPSTSRTSKNIRQVLVAINWNWWLTVCESVEGFHELSRK